MTETLERIIPEKLDNNLNLISHLNRYEWASLIAKGKVVIDAACGVGYGSKILASNGAKKVTGFDISGEAIKYALKNYKSNNLNFVKTDITKGFGTKQENVDVIVTLETIEHLKDPEAFIKKSKTYLGNNGVFLASVPNDKVWHDFKNEFHLTSFTEESFVAMLRSNFKYVNLYNQYFDSASIIVPNNKFIKNVKKEVIYSNHSNDDAAPYFIAVCSDSKISNISTSKVYLSSESIVNGWKYSNYLNYQIANFKKELDYKNKELNMYNQSILIRVMKIINKIFKNEKSI